MTNKLLKLWACIKYVLEKSAFSALLIFYFISCEVGRRTCTPGGALGYFLGGYVPPRTPNWHPVLKKNSPKIDTPF